LSGRRKTNGAEPVFSIWEVAALGVAVCSSLGLGFANLGAPSLWHDELVHVFVGKRIAETGRPELPSGQFYASGTMFNYVLAGVIAALGDSEAVVRAPAVVFGAASVVLTFFVIRRLLGRGTAIVAAFSLALSPWAVAWARQARYYTLQQAAYLVAMWIVWRVFSVEDPKRRVVFAVAAFATYVLGLLCGFQSILFVAPVAAYGFLMALHTKRWRSHWTGLACGAVIAGAATLLFYRLGLPQVDIKAMFDRGGLGGQFTEVTRQVRGFYLVWLHQNLSAGFFYLALLGFVIMVLKERGRGIFVVLSFWAPLLALTFLYGYRRPRFMYFAFPFWVAGFSYGLVQLGIAVSRARRSWLHGCLAVIILVFGGRLALSTYHLLGDSIKTASGADVTLARRIPQWRAPCRYVGEHLDSETAVLSTTYLPALYYVGRVDDWFPSRLFQNEYWEIGMPGLRTVEELEVFMRERPRGYFLAEQQRLAFWARYCPEERARLDGRMTRVDEACSGDVAVFSWGM